MCQKYQIIATRIQKVFDVEPNFIGHNIEEIRVKPANDVTVALGRANVLKNAQLYEKYYLN